MINKLIYVLIPLLLAGLSGCGTDNNECTKEVAPTQKTTAFYADNANNQIDIIDVDTMKLIDTLATGHIDTHTAGIALTTPTTTKLYSSNRHDNYIDVIDTKLKNITKSIYLEFHPRSINAQTETNLVEVASTDKAAAAIIDAKTDEVIATVGDLNQTMVNKCGHPYWLDAEDFVFIDRDNKKIYTYNIKKENGVWTTKELNSLDTNSSIHHIATPNVNGKRNYNATVFYAMEEGDGVNGIYPAVLKLAYSKTIGLSIIERLDLNTSGADANVTGGHHLDFLRDGKTLYAGSKEGNLYVVDYSTSPMHILKTIPVGKGAGHTTEMKTNNLAVIINHNANFITLVDTALNEKIGDVLVSNLSDEEATQVQVQSHTNYYFSEDQKYFYIFLTEEGDLVKVDLVTKKVVDRLHVGGKPEMGSFIHTYE